MASYQQVIELVVKGQEQLAKLERRVKELNKEADRLKTEPAKAGTGALAETIQEAAAGQQALNKATKQDLLNRIKLNSAVDLYGRRLRQVQTTAAADQKQFAQSIKDIQAAFQAFKTDGDISGIQAVSTELGRILEYSREIQRNEVGREKSNVRLRGYLNQIGELKAAGLNTSKVENLVQKAGVALGTKKFKNAEKLEVKIKERLGLLKKEKQQIDANNRAAAKRTRARAKAKGQRFQDLALGAGFPLLFGGGAGQVLGGLAGALSGGGFGGQILGAALGQQFEDAAIRVRELDKAIQNLDLSALTDSTLLMNAELRETVQNFIDLGESQRAVELLAKETLAQTGLLPESIRDSARATLRLSNAWDESVGAVSGLLAMLSTDLIDTLGLSLRIINQGVKGINTLVSNARKIGKGGSDSPKTPDSIKNFVGFTAQKFVSEATQTLPGLREFRQATTFLADILGLTNEIDEATESRVFDLKQSSKELQKEVALDTQLLEIEQRRKQGTTAAAKLNQAQVEKDLALTKLKIKTEKAIVEKRREYQSVNSKVLQDMITEDILAIRQLDTNEKARINKKFALAEEAAGIQKAKELAKQQAKERKQALDNERQVLQNNLTILQNTVGIERERNNLALSRISLDQTLSNIKLKDFEFVKAAREAGLSDLEQIKLMGLERVNSLNIEKRIAQVRQSNTSIAREEEKMLRKQAVAKLDAAKLEYDSQLLSIDASVSKAKIEKQITKIQSQQLKIQITSLKLEAAAIKDAEAKRDALANINREQALVNEQVAEIERLSDNNLKTVTEQADIQREIAKNKYDELKATIRSEELERRRSKALSEIEAKSARIAQNTRAAAEASNRISSTNGVQLGRTTTQTVSTSMKIDPDVYQSVIDNAPAFGYKNTYELTAALDKAQQVKNAQMAKAAQMSQPSATSYSPTYNTGTALAATPLTSTVNVSTGPVMQVDNKRYVSMEDFESGLRQVSSANAAYGRSYAGRRYGGVA